MPELDDVPLSAADDPPLSEVDDVSLSDLGAPSSDFAAPLSAESGFEPLAALAAFDVPRSFFAQPDPRKWIVGGANNLRIVPSLPQDGQNVGPGSFKPCRMSVRWSQEVQAYS